MALFYNLLDIDHEYTIVEAVANLSKPLYIIFEMHSPIEMCLGKQGMLNPAIKRHSTVVLVSQANINSAESNKKCIKCVTWLME